MGYLTADVLLGYRPTVPVTRLSNIQESRETAELTIFLSHSHLDRRLVEGLIGLFDRLGIKIYVDWNDHDMPRVTDRETAERIKTKITENALFVILATSAAMVSRWVPWETGIADQVKGAESILLIPVADPTGRFEGNEYMQLYDRFELGPAAYRLPIPSRFRILAPNGRDLRSLEEHFKSKEGRVL